MFTSGDLSVGGFMPPYLIGRGSGSVMMTLVGIGIIMIIPELIKEMKKGLKIDGGIWEVLAFKALDQVKEGAPIGSRLAGAGLMTAAKLPGQIGKATLETRGVPLAQRLGRIGKSVGYGVGESLSTGSKAGATLAGYAGGKTPAGAQFIETGVSKVLEHNAPEAFIERAEKRQDYLGRAHDRKDSVAKKVEEAKERGENIAKRKQEGY